MILRSSSIAFIPITRLTSSGMCSGAMRVRAVFEAREISLSFVQKTMPGCVGGTDRRGDNICISIYNPTV